MTIARKLLAATAALTLGFSIQAAEIFNDTTGFADWYQGGDALTLTTGSDLVKSGTSGISAYEVIGRSFAETSLAVGEIMEFTFDWTQSSSSVSIIKIGLFDNQNAITADGWADATLGTYDGYHSFLRDNSSDDNKARRETGTNTDNANAPLVGGTTIGSSANKVDLNQDGTVTYDVLFSVTRSGADQVDTLFDIRQGGSSVLSLIGTESSDTLNTFNTAFIRTSGGTSTFDNINVSVIPEPSTLALLGIALGSLMLFRRRKS